jgi:hypothetical protein
MGAQPRSKRRQEGSRQQESKEAAESVPRMRFSYKRVRRDGIVCIWDNPHRYAPPLVSNDVAMIAYEKVDLTNPKPQRGRPDASDHSGLQRQKIG